MPDTQAIFLYTAGMNESDFQLHTLLSLRELTLLTLLTLREVQGSNNTSFSVDST